MGYQNIKAFFSSFQTISELSFGGLVDHYLKMADVKNEKNSLITYKDIKEFVMNKLSWSPCMCMKLSKKKPMYTDF